MSKKCECCGRVQEKRQCSYCGFVSVVALDKEGEAFNRQRAKEHKQQLIDSLHQINILAFNFRANADCTAMEAIGGVELPVCTGKECYEKIVWAPYNFGHQGLEENRLEINLALDFPNRDFNKITCAVTPPEVNDFWQVGFRVTKELKLEVLFGRPENYVTVKVEPEWFVQA